MDTESERDNSSMTSIDRLVSIIPVRLEDDLASTLSLFKAYTSALGFDLAFQNFSEEMASMPGKYSIPKGELLLAKTSAGTPVGCVALRPLPAHGEHVCEMKRLYVTPEGRGTGAGKALALAVIEAAEARGYKEMRLDTLPRMTAALALYERLGFVDIPAYYETPLEGTRFLSLRLPQG
jgi:ribosomal protein S18 acetylase RimI-like enzyme